MEISLIYPPLIDHTVDLPYGLGILNASLRKHNFSCHLFDANALIKKSYSTKMFLDIVKFHRIQEKQGYYSGLSDERNEKLADTLLNLISFGSCDLVGIGITSSLQILPGLLIAEKIKKEYRIPIVFGGPYVTVCANLFFKKHPFIDYAIIGEGEVPLVRLLHFMQGHGTIDDVPSLWYRTDDGCKFNARAYYNVEDQITPDYEGLFPNLYRRYIEPHENAFVIPYLISRGCNFQCSFCLHPFISGSWSPKSIEKVIREIVFLKEKYYVKDRKSYFYFVDSCFDFSYDFTDSLCDAFIERELDIQWAAFVKGESCDKHLLSKMKAAGCHTLKWGVESGSNRILKLMRKQTNVETQSKILQIAHGIGIRNQLYIIFGYPYETTNDLWQTRLFLQDNANAIDLVTFYRLGVFYNSPLFRNRKNERIRLKKTKLHSIHIVIVLKK